MIDLRRNLAPMSGEAWARIDREAERVLKLNLAARKLVDFSGPLGWEASALSTGRVEKIQGPTEGVEGLRRRVLPLVELRVEFEIAREEIDAIDRGAKDNDLDAVVDAAKAIARAEDHAVFYGYGAAGMRGILEVSQHEPLPISEDYQAYPATVSDALERLRQAGVDGPYAIALGPRCYAGLMRSFGPGGYPVYQHVRRLVDDRVVWAPAIDGAVVMSVAGGDYELSVGQDFSIGYLSHTATSVRLYLVESFAFQALTHEAAVGLKYASKAKDRGAIKV
jgi:uncharacterized linocin/CFP29 family protein